MTNNIYTRSIAICLSMIALSSCAGMRHDIEQFFKPKVSENPYKGMKPRTHTPRTQTASNQANPAQSAQQWAPTTRTATTPAAQQPRPQTPVVQASKPSTPPKKIDIAGSAPPPSATNNTSSTVTQVAAPPKKPALNPTTPAVKPTAPAVKPPAQPKPEEMIHTVSPVANKPTHVHHPLNPAKIIRVSNAQGVKYPSGTIMRVPGESIRFYVP